MTWCIDRPAVYLGFGCFIGSPLTFCSLILHYAMSNNLELQLKLGILFVRINSQWT